MCNLTDNFMEDALFHLKLKSEYEYRMWEQFVKEREEEERCYDIMAEQANKDQELYETLMMEKEYRSIEEWEIINNLK
jgi:hypothetical protein